MIPSIPSLFASSLSLVALVSAQYPDELVGTWVSKSRSVVTGPEFYNPVADSFTEPKHAGIAYSFTSDGHYEQAFYRAVANPTTPRCPSSIMQWQHGTYSLPGNGSIVLEPFSVDGRQLLSSPCSYDTAVLTRYDQPELIKRYEAITDDFHNVPRLNIFQHDGAREQPLYLAFKPPQMLPTQTLNPTAAATPTSKVKRDMDRQEHRDLAQKIIKNDFQVKPGMPTLKPAHWDPDNWWWAGFGFIAIGTVMYMMPTSV